MACLDHHGNQRQPGDRWLKNQTTNCTCIDPNLVICELLKEPVCMDISGNLRKNGETWMNSSCVDCSCINGSINCTGYNVNITYGLFNVELFPTCEKCHILLSAENLHTCKGKLNLFSSYFHVTVQTNDHVLLHVLSCSNCYTQFRLDQCDF